MGLQLDQTEASVEADSRQPGEGATIHCILAAHAL